MTATATSHEIADGGAIGAPLAGSALLRPFVGSSIVVLIVNDHLLKQRWPGLVTGKLSDVAGLVFFPVLLVALWEGGHLVGRRRDGRPANAGRGVMVGAALLTGLGFSVVTVSATTAGWYSNALGDLAWPVRALGSLATGAAIHAPAPVVVRADPWDLLALPAIALGLQRMRRATTTTGGPETGRRCGVPVAHQAPDGREARPEPHPRPEARGSSAGRPTLDAGQSWSRRARMSSP